MDKNGTIHGIFGSPRALIGMIHVEALPGTPKSQLDLTAIVAKALDEARLYLELGFDGLMMENMHDLPYLCGSVGPEVTAAMTVIGHAVRNDVDLPLGMQILAGANHEALAASLACGASFIRVEGFVFAHVGDEGLHEAGAAELLRYRRAIGAEHIKVFADIKKKHSAHTLTADVDLEATAHAAEFFLADGLVVTGTATGSATDPGEVERVAAAVSIPTLVGSGVDIDNVSDYLAADALIVGSSVKQSGLWSNPIDRERCEALVRAFQC